MPDPENNNRSCPLLDRLPRELIPRILLHLDSFSLRALLSAFPSIASGCVLIVEDWDPEEEDPYGFNWGCCFFNECSSLRKVMLKEYNPLIHRAYFKIYEASALRPKDHRLKMDLHKRLPYISKADCFVHYFTECVGEIDRQYDPHECLLAKHHRDRDQQLTPTLFKAGIAFDSTHIRHHQRTLDQLPPPGAPSSMSYTIRHLRIEGRETIIGLTVPPLLESFTVVFQRSHMNPAIKDINFGRNLQSGTGWSKHLRLTIYYHDKLPLIERVVLPRHYCVSGHRAGDYTCSKNTLVLVHIPSMSGNLATELSPHPEEGSDFGSLTAALCDQFGVVEIVGGPNNLVEGFARGKEVLSLKWKQTCRLLSRGFRPLTLTGVEKLETFIFETVLEKPVVPMLAGQKSSLRCVSIRSHHGLNTSTLSLRKPGSEVRELYIDVTRSSPAEFLSSIGDLAQDLDRAAGHFVGLEIVGLRSSALVDVDSLRRRRTLMRRDPIISLVD